MIHRHLAKIKSYDAMFLAALAIAAYIHLGYVWLIYAITIMVSTSIFTLVKEIMSWFKYIGDEIHFNARCIRDRDYTYVIKEEK